MNCEIICVGTEMLTGGILNTNVRYLSQALSEMGISVHRHTTVGDNPGRLRAAVVQALEDNDLLVITGGLGPTQDDLTKETVAEALGKELIPNPDIENYLVNWFRDRGMEMTPNNLKQALVPEGARILRNPGGTAPGIFIQENGKSVALLPGPPKEMETVFNVSLREILKEISDNQVASRFYNLTGIGESQVEDIILDIVDAQTNPTIATYAKPGEVLIRLTASGKDAEELMDEKERIIIDRLGEHIFTHSKNRLADVVGRYLIDHDLTIATAESCTGGMISSELASIPGISKSFMLGLVTYSNEAKEKVLGVSPETLKRYGAVSPETCREMCENVRGILGTDIGVSVTGIAGPDGGTEEKPVGLVYTGISTKNGTRILENHFAGDRAAVRTRSTNMVFQMIRKEFFICY